jgi:hypothetical protein
MRQPSSEVPRRVAWVCLELCTGCTNFGRSRVSGGGAGISRIHLKDFLEYSRRAIALGRGSGDRGFDIREAKVVALEQQWRGAELRQGIGIAITQV